MTHNLSGKNIAILIANGFVQSDVVAAQRMFQEAKASVKLISSENGLVNGWEGKSWGHHFAADIPLSKALAADFDMVIIPGGAAHVEKLLKTEHTKRFINSFMRAQKVIVAFSDGLKVLVETGMLRGYEVSAPEHLVSDMSGEGATISTEVICADDHLITTSLSGENQLDVYALACLAVIDSEMDMEVTQAA
jgi:protease I